MAGTLEPPAAGSADDTGLDAVLVLKNTGTRNDGKRVRVLAFIDPATGLAIPPAGGPVALSSPPSALTPNVETVFTFSSQVRHIFLQNNSATPVGVEFDAPATAGSTQTAPMGGIAKSDDFLYTTVHLYSTAATPVNGSAGSNIVLKGWA